MSEQPFGPPPSERIDEALSAAAPHLDDMPPVRRRSYDVLRKYRNGWLALWALEGWLDKQDLWPSKEKTS